MVMSFDKANSSFRDRQQEYMRFASSRSLPAHLRRKLLTYSLQDWAVNQGYDPYEVIRSNRLPPALSNSILAAIYDDVVPDSPLLRIIDKPCLHELLKMVKVVISMQKETLVNQSDLCQRVYILRQGSLQASATEKLMQQAQQNAAPQRQATKMSRQSGWKQKMQVRMIERPGEVICPASPFDAPKTLPFQITSLKRSTLLAIQMQARAAAATPTTPPPPPHLRHPLALAPLRPRTPSPSPPLAPSPLCPIVGGARSGLPPVTAARARSRCPPCWDGWRRT